MTNGNMKVSDFKVAQNILKGYCAKLGVPFVDVPISFDESSQYDVQASYDGESVVVGDTDKLGKTLLTIVANYLDAIEIIHGRAIEASNETKNQMLVNATAVIRDFIYGSGDQSFSESFEFPNERSPMVSLSHFPFTWIVMRDLVCPVNETELKDIHVVLDRSPRHDVAVCGEMKIADIDEPIIFINKEVESDAVRTAFVLIAAIQSHGLDTVKVAVDLLSNELFREKFVGLVKLAFVDMDLVEQFVTAFSIASGHPMPEKLMGGLADVSMLQKAKVAQVTGRFQDQKGYDGGGVAMGGAWMFPSLTEGMIGAFHGSDRTVREILHPLTESIWKKVTDEKKRRGKVDMTLEDMLMAHAKDMKVSPNNTLQGLLAEQRIW